MAPLRAVVLCLFVFSRGAIWCLQLPRKAFSARVPRQTLPLVAFSPATRGPAERGQAAVGRGERGAAGAAGCGSLWLRVGPGLLCAARHLLIPEPVCVLMRKPFLSFLT